MVEESHTAAILYLRKLCQRYFLNNSSLYLHRSELVHSLPIALGAPAVPYRVFPQGSIICGSAVNRDSSLLAVGMQSGVVTMWNQKTGEDANTDG